MKAENQNKIEAEVKRVFPTASFRRNSQSIRAHVKQLGMNQLVFIHDLAGEINSDVNMKRSGTGISIIFS